MASVREREDMMLRPKHPATPIAGPYGHPFHPILVTIPIGAWVASLVFDLISRTADDPAAFGTGAMWLIGIGIVGSMAAAPFGLMDLVRIPRGTRAFRTGITHMMLNLTVSGIFLIQLLMRRGQADEATGAGFIVASIVALGLLVVSGALGGTLAYKYGVRVADQTTQYEHGYADAGEARRRKLPPA